MEEQYSSSIKYNESWLHRKDKRKYVEYWAVLKGTILFFFKDQNTHAKEQFVGSIEIKENTEVIEQSTKKEGRCGFKLRNGKDISCFRAQDDILRKRWVHAFQLSKNRLPPGPLPGDLDFMTDGAVSNNNMTWRLGSENNSSPFTTRDVRPLSICDPTLTELPPPPPPKVSSPTMRSQQASIDDDSDDSEGYQHIEDAYDCVFLDGNINTLAWYHGGISRGEAEEIMCDKPIGSYLLRDSGHSAPSDAYTITVKDKPRLKHHRLIKYGDHYAFEGSEHILFKNAPEAVAYLMRHSYEKLDTQPVSKHPNLTRRLPGDGTDSVSRPFKEHTKRATFAAEGRHRSLDDVILSQSPRGGSPNRTRASTFTDHSLRPLPAVPSGEQLDFKSSDPQEDQYVNSLAIRLQDALQSRPQGRHSITSMVQTRTPPPPPAGPRRVSAPGYENSSVNRGDSPAVQRNNRLTGIYDPCRHVQM